MQDGKLAFHLAYFLSCHHIEWMSNIHKRDEGKL